MLSKTAHFIFDLVRTLGFKFAQSRSAPSGKNVWRPARESNPCRPVKGKPPVVIQRNLAAWVASEGSQRYFKGSLLDPYGRAEILLGSHCSCIRRPHPLLIPRSLQRCLAVGPAAPGRRCAISFARELSRKKKRFSSRPSPVDNLQLPYGIQDAEPSANSTACVTLMLLPFSSAARTEPSSSIAVTLSA